MMSDKVLIMMATYNGEKFIREQLESIIRQTYKDWNLIIQDDGSQDKTVEIIQEYIDKDSRINLVKNNNKFHGAYYNFHSLINSCKGLDNYGYYAFADQDDIWNEKKIEKLVYRLERNPDEPMLLYTDMKIIDRDGNVTNESIVNTLGLRIANPESSFFGHQVYGCSIMMNNKLFKIVPKVDLNRKITKILSHDNFYAKFAASYGKLEYYDDRLVNYRRYDGNVTAKYQYNFKLSRIVKRMLNFKELGKDHARTYKQTLETIKYIKKDNNLDIKVKVDEIEKVLLKGGISAGIFVMQNNIRWGNKIKDISHVVVLITGIYKKFLLY